MLRVSPGSIIDAHMDGHKEVIDWGLDKLSISSQHHRYGHPIRNKCSVIACLDGRWTFLSSTKGISSHSHLLLLLSADAWFKFDQIWSLSWWSLFRLSASRTLNLSLPVCRWSRSLPQLPNLMSPAYSISAIHPSTPYSLWLSLLWCNAGSVSCL